MIKKEWSKKYYQEHREKWKNASKNAKKWRKNHKEQIREYNKSSKYKAWRKEYRKYKRETDIQYRLNANMASAISNFLKGKKKKEKWEIVIGYDLQDLIKHLENQFDDKMNWDNYGSYWEIDHKIPKSWFHYVSLENIEFQKCWALENLQPLEKRENWRKNNRYKSN